jgi:tetratricopeptide (TPR) repeat protein
MSNRLFWPSGSWCGTRVLYAAIGVCVCAALRADADERPIGSNGASVRTSATASAKQAQPATRSTKPTDRQIEQLIRDLGNPRYTARRAAASELRQIGTEAFDLLYAATDDADPEVAASANYLLRQIPVRWVQPDDSPAVRSKMRQYGQEPEASRIQRIGQLDRLSGESGTAALCRIARYDRSPIASRTAALAVIRPAEKGSHESRPDPEVVERELGASKRAAAAWLRQYVIQLRDPTTSVAAWKQLIDQESARLEKSTGDTSGDIVLGLYWNLADVYRQIGDRAALNGALDRMIGLAADGSDATLVNLLTWLTENKSWDVLDTFLAKHQARLEQGKRTLYYAALARSKQGKKEAADELAVKAAALPPQSALDGLSIAHDLEEHNQFDWAVREYRRAIDKQPDESLENILARLYLPNLLHDYEREKEAADTIEPLMKALQREGRVSQVYNQIREYNAARDYNPAREDGDDRSSLPSPRVISARYHSYRACQYQQAKDWSRARGELELAINFDPSDADVLINMYRLPETDAKWHAGVVARIRKLTQQFDRDIEENPSDPAPYNQWAWLISNTEGDYQKAIRYSHRSLELNTHGESGAASFLDTLGRCYYAVGDYKNAVKYERQAIAKNDYMQVMQRQLKQFEKALADQQASGKSK